MQASMNRRQLITAAASAVAVASFGRAAAANPARIVVGFPAGTAVDLLGRVVAPAVEKVLGRPVIVENKPGAGGRFAPKAVHASKPGDAMLTIIPGGALTLFPFVYRNVGYETNLTPIAKLMDVDMGLACAPTLPVRSMAELRDWVRTPEGRRASYGSSGVGSILHFLGVGVSRALKADWNHVPYSGAMPLIADLSTGTLPLGFGTLTGWPKFAAEGKLRILATASAQRAPYLPEIPTFRESGIDLAVTTWYALYGRPGLPPEQVQALYRAVAGVMKQPQVQAQLSTAGVVAVGSPEEMARLQAAETALWRDLVRVSGFQPAE